jgi:hypothetical protein
MACKRDCDPWEVPGRDRKGLLGISPLSGTTQKSSSSINPGQRYSTQKFDTVLTHVKQGFEFLK